MNSLFYYCFELKVLNLSNFNATKVEYINDMFNGCNNLENINLINAKINPNIISSSIFSNLPSKLIICTEDEDWLKIFDLSDKQYVNCINNISYFNINEYEPIIKCYKNNIESDNPCQMCGNNYFNNSGIINNTYINCYEVNYIDDSSYQVPLDTTINNAKENSVNTIDINDYTNSISNEESDKYTHLFSQLLTTDYSFFDSSIIIIKENEIKNRTELIQNMINNLIDKFNISYIDNGKDEKTNGTNISLILTSTKNQKKNENEKIITIDLGECENILKKEYNISSNEPLYILQIIPEKEEGMKIPKIDYDVYYPFYNNNILQK